MHQTETHTLHGIVLRLLDAIPAHLSEALVLARWIGTRADIFGPVPPAAPAGRHKPGVTPPPYDQDIKGSVIGGPVKKDMRSYREP